MVDTASDNNNHPYTSWSKKYKIWKQTFENIWDGIAKTRVRVPVYIHVFYINRSCFQLEDALARGSKSRTLYIEHC